MSEPFKVVFNFSSPVLIDNERPLHLDALIAYAIMKEAEEMGHDDAWRAADDLAGYLERTHGEEEWVWKASHLVFTPAAEPFMINMTRRSDPPRYFSDLGKYWVGGNRFDETTFKINTQSGQQRGYQWLAAAQWMVQAEAWGIGDIEAITHCLTRIRHIGKMGRNGFGCISGFTVTPAPDNAECWRLRTLPKDEPGMAGIQYEPVIASLRAPYWRKTPGARVVAREPI